MNLPDLLSRVRVFLFGPQKPVQSKPIWKVEREENLGSYVHYGDDVHDICDMYRIAVYERDLVSGSTRIRERVDMFPAKENAS